MNHLKVKKIDPKTKKIDFGKGAILKIVIIISKNTVSIFTWINEIDRESLFLRRATTLSTVHFNY